MKSLIKKSEIIKEFSKQLSNLKLAPKLFTKLDLAFFKILNKIYLYKPHDVKIHITKNGSLVFNIEFSNERMIYFEHFINKSPNTILSFNKNGDNFETHDDLFHENLENALSKIDKILN